jgi:DNA-directed RNA polymerase specialized sigma24 family protein
VYGRVWEFEEIDLLRSYRKRGVSLRETARALGRSYSAVKSYASDHGILADGPGAWSPADDACLVLLGRGGTSVDEIAELMGRTASAVRHRLVRLNLRLSDLRVLGPMAPKT